jgi:phosphoribosylformylglycinamidine synthase
LLDAGLAVGVQDLGAAGITGATSETAAKGGAGLDVYLSEVPVREPNMEPFEVMTSESQERMLAIVKPEHLDEVQSICERWEVTASVIGTVTGSGRLRVLDRFDGDVLADMPATSLDEYAPRYDRPMQAPASTPEAAPPITDAAAHVLSQLADSSWVWSQYYHQLFQKTVVGPGDDATVLRLKHPTTGVDTGRALALTTDGNHRWCANDPRVGTAWIVAEAALNLACVGARPLALVNCLNFGNPEHPEVMWQLSESIDGMGEACRALRIPVVGGNVSLYNESRGHDIDPTPIVGMLGIIDALSGRPPVATLTDGGTLVVLGPAAGTPLDYDAHRAVCELVAGLVNDGVVDGVHDVSDSGLALALAEMAVRSRTGFEVAYDDALLESPSRVVVCVPAGNVPEVHRRHTEAGVAAQLIGKAGGHRLVIDGVIDIALDDALTAWRDRLPAALGAGTAQ